MKVLLTGGIACLAASILHVGILIGGPDWFRYFGAGEHTARLVEQGSRNPIISTTLIAVVLAVFGLYGILGSLQNIHLPYLKPALILISTIFLIRGIIGIPVVLLIDDPYMNELKTRMMFITVTSIISLGIGACYLYGLVKIWKH